MKRHDAKTAKDPEEPDAELDRWAHQVVGAALEFIERSDLDFLSRSTGKPCVPNYSAGPSHFVARCPSLSDTRARSLARANWTC